MDAPVLPLPVRGADQRGGDASCLYGSVVRLDQAAPECDECEQRRARFECGDCGLVYCAPCDAHRHRKGKLAFHQRARLRASSPASPSSLAASRAEADGDHVDHGDEHRGGRGGGEGEGGEGEGEGEEEEEGETAVSRWSDAHVADWLRANDLDVFVEDARRLGLDGAALLAAESVDAFLDAAACAASRGHKKKLQREVQKLREAAPDGAACDRAPASESASRPSLRLRVDASPRATRAAERPGAGAGGPEAASFSPVAALRARLAHGQTGEDARGRVLRRRSAFPGSALPGSALPGSALPGSALMNEAPALAPRASAGSDEARPSMTEKRGRSFFLETGALKIDVETPSPLRGAAPPTVDDREAEKGGASGSKRQLAGVGALGLDMAQVKREENALGASFDFSATGRLQTQGFEINTNGIANAPFPSRYHAVRKDSAATAASTPTASAGTPSSTASSSPSLSSPPSLSMGTRDYLLVLDELGHGASGKVFKALYLPTFKLVAVKVIRVYDQKKRHQMVRELKSLYVNFVPIAEADSLAGAACEELVVFFDAFTNPEAGSVSIVLEYMDGGSVEDCMQAARGAEVSEPALANLAHGVLRGLAFLHEHHQLHRDIKLSNMLINRTGQVKISDFGISRDLESTLAKATTFTGTLLYMAPERISGGMYSYPSDIWSFGLAVMTYAIGRLPVPTQDGYWGVVHAVKDKPSPRLQDFGSHFSPELCDFIDQCLQKNPLARPSASQLLRHPFIVNNHRSPRDSSSASLFPGLADPSNGDFDKKDRELEAIASKVESWCQAHADSLLATTACQSPSSSVFHRVSVAQKAEALARQLRLPKEQVAARFAFLERFCAGE